MASIPKKKRKVNKRARSRAAKKGWQTRRQRNPELLVSWRKRQSEKKARKARKSSRSVEERVIREEVNRRVALIEADMKLENERIRSRLVKETVDSTLEEILNSAPPGFEPPDSMTAIRTRMDMADFSGDPELEAGVLADEFNYEVRDIYTIWYGSDPSDFA